MQLLPPSSTKEPMHWFSILLWIHVSQYFLRNQKSSLPKSWIQSFTASHDQFPYSLFPLRNQITPPSSLPRSPLSILSQSHLVNMSRARLRDLIPGDGSAASEAETRRGISQKRLTGERRGGNWDGKWMWVFFLAVNPRWATSVKPREHRRGSTWSEEGGGRWGISNTQEHPDWVQSDNPHLKFVLLECQKQEHKRSFTLICP